MIVFLKIALNSEKFEVKTSDWTQIMYNLKMFTSEIDLIKRPSAYCHTLRNASITHLDLLLIKKPNKARYTATPVACWWAGAIFEIT